MERILINGEPANIKSNPYAVTPAVLGENNRPTWGKTLLKGVVMTVAFCFVILVGILLCMVW